MVDKTMVAAITGAINNPARVDRIKLKVHLNKDIYRYFVIILKHT
jgi:hypothetical protein